MQDNPDLSWDGNTQKGKIKHKPSIKMVKIIWMQITTLLKENLLQQQEWAGSLDMLTLKKIKYRIW